MLPPVFFEAPLLFIVVPTVPVHLQALQKRAEWNYPGWDLASGH